jgi:hypothetical protein
MVRVGDLDDYYPATFLHSLDTALSVARAYAEEGSLPTGYDWKQVKKGRAAE